MAQESSVTVGVDAARSNALALSWWLAIVRGVVGGAVGAAMGYYAFFWLLDRGMYAIVACTPWFCLARSSV